MAGNTGIFQGIENGMMKIEYQVTEFVNHRNGPDENGHWSDLVVSTKIFSYPVGGDSHRDIAFYGFGPNEGSMGFCPDLPAVGQKVAYEGPTPDGAGHLMVYVRAIEEFTGVVTGTTTAKEVNNRFDQPKMRTFSITTNVRRADGSLARSHVWLPGQLPTGPIRFIGTWTDSSSKGEPRTIDLVKVVT